MKSVFDKTTTG